MLVARSFVHPRYFCFWLQQSEHLLDSLSVLYVQDRLCFRSTPQKSHDTPDSGVKYLATFLHISLPQMSLITSL